MYLNVAQGLGAGARPMPRAWRARGGAVAIRVPNVLAYRPGFKRRGVGDCGWVNGSWVNVLPNGSIMGCGAPPSPAPVTGGSLASDSIANYYAGIAANPYLNSPAYLAAEAASGAPDPGAAADAAATLVGYCQQNAFNNSIWNTPLDTATCKGAIPLQSATDIVKTVQPTNFNFGATPVAVTNQSPLAGPAQPAAVSAKVTLNNVTRPGQSFQVGDSFQLILTGTPGQPVSSSATQNGKSLGTTSYGTMPSSGQLIINGQFDSTVVGDWKEMWTVGTSAAPVLSFSVSAAPAAAGSGSGAAAGSGSAAGAGSGAGSSGSSSGSGNGAPAPATGGFDFSSITSALTSDVSLFGFNIPVWGIGAAVLGGLWLMGGSSRRRG